ncbi:MAG TPA: alanine racemase [Chloroflexota bacterium]|nr:alanine racemase [Chloroflexota bacterium]
MPDVPDPTRTLSCWLDVDLDAIQRNVRQIRRWVRPGTDVAAVVKAHGYGAGAVEVARAVLRAGAKWLAVARVHEGVELRRAGLDAPILVLTRTEPAEADVAVRYDLTVTVDTIDLIRALDRAARRHARSATVHVKVDTGLHRFGVDPERALDLARELASSDGLDVQAIYTHFASADETDLSYTYDQLDRFNRVVADLARAGYEFPIRHACNSAATMALPDAHFGLVRTGLLLYGVSPNGNVPDGFDLQPAVSLRARVARVTCLARGEGVGYGQTWHAPRPTRVALVSAGYADGIDRRLSNVGEALVRGQVAPIIGRVSMDQTVVDITDIPGAAEGDVATFFGADGQRVIGLNHFADQAGTIPHVALTNIGGRVARVYREGGEPPRLQRLNGVQELCPAE